MTVHTLKKYTEKLDKLLDTKLLPCYKSGEYKDSEKYRKKLQKKYSSLGIDVDDKFSDVYPGFYPDEFQYFFLHRVNDDDSSDDYPLTPTRGMSLRLYMNWWFKNEKNLKNYLCNSSFWKFASKYRINEYHVAKSSNNEDFNIKKHWSIPGHDWVYEKLSNEYNTADYCISLGQSACFREWEKKYTYGLDKDFTCEAKNGGELVKEVMQLTAAMVRALAINKGTTQEWFLKFIESFFLEIFESFPIKKSGGFE